MIIFYLKERDFMKKKLTLLLACLFLSIGMAIAQSKVSVSGTVVSASDGLPVVGASVKVLGTRTGTVTNTDGKFYIDAPSTAKQLEVSYVGMLSKVVKVGKNLRIVLEDDSKTLDEVMVVAYGKAKKSAFTGSAAVIKADKMENRQVVNVSQALNGEVAGVQVTQPSGKPGETASVRIRGIGSMASSNAPLYVIDGVPYDGDISAINTADIESTTVLKDAASNALYGARGANGVILITTKRGKVGEAQITLDARWGSESRAVSNYDVVKDPATYLEKAYESIYNGLTGTKYAKTTADQNKYANKYLGTNSNGGVGYQIYTVPTNELLIGTDGKINPNATLGYSDGNFYYTPDNWYDEIFNSGNLRQEYNASVSGATDKVNYFVSGGYLKDEGIIDNSGFTRYSSRAKVDYQAKSWLKLGTNLSYTNYESDYPVTDKNDWNSLSSANLFFLANFIAPIYPMYVRSATDKSIMTDSNGFTVYDYGDGTSAGQKRTFMSGSNPAGAGSLDKNKYVADVLSTRWFAEFKIFDGLKFTYNLGVDVDNTRRSVLYNSYYGQYSKSGGVITKESSRNFSINNQQLLNYTNVFGGVHDVDILLGHETYKLNMESLWGNKDHIFNPSIIELDNAILNPTTGSSTDHYSTEGWFGRVRYEYAQKYVLSGSFRRDASSLFTKDNRWGNFGSLSGAWVITKEDFMKSLDWMQFLKYKISWGVQGNDALLYQGSAYRNYKPSEDQYKVVENNGDYATSLYYKGNNDITWETSYSFNTGFDFNLFDNKLNGSIEYYNRKTNDLLYYMPVPPEAGYGYYPMNVGSVRNYGFEFDLNSDIYKSKDVKVNIYANATTWRNKIVKLAPELNGKWIDGTSIYQEGESMYQYYMRKFAGVYNGDATEIVDGETPTLGQALYYEDITDANGNVTAVKKTANWASATQYALGDRLPDVYGGFGATVKAYGFDFSISCAYQLGGKCYDSGYARLMHGGTASTAGGGWSTDILNSWSSTNTNTDIPRVCASDKYANAASDRWITSSNYLDITNMSFGYTLPKSITSMLQISSVRFYVTADNVALFAKRKGLDPRQSYGSNTALQYSAVRTISGGISVKF